jgi:hypothetical protein
MIPISASTHPMSRHRPTVAINRVKPTFPSPQITGPNYPSVKDNRKGRAAGKILE